MTSDKVELRNQKSGLSKFDRKSIKSKKRKVSEIPTSSSGLKTVAVVDDYGLLKNVYKQL